VLIKEKGNLSFFQFLNLSRFSKIRHGIFTRKNGFSKKPFHSLNISFDVGDNPENVKSNRKAIEECFGTRTNIAIYGISETNSFGPGVRA
jgi:copper oxidase (laccase) domain-containing protein